MSWYSKFKVAKVNGFDMLVDPQDDNISQILLNEWSPRLLIESPDKEYLTALGYKMQENLYSGQGPLEYWVKP